MQGVQTAGMMVGLWEGHSLGPPSGTPGYQYPAVSAAGFGVRGVTSRGPFRTLYPETVSSKLSWCWSRVRESGAKGGATLRPVLHLLGVQGRPWCAALS